MHATVHLGLTPIISSPLQISDVCLDGIKGAMVMSTTQYSMDVARVHFIQTTPHYCQSQCQSNRDPLTEASPGTLQ